MTPSHNIHYNRFLSFPDKSFFLFGPRGVGKSTLLKQNMSRALYLDLLKGNLFLELSVNPSGLESMVSHLDSGQWVIIDEIQKIPALLDEVHRIIEEKRLKFALCGSSARKLKRMGTNLLGGRALSLNLESFSVMELGSDLNWDYCLEWGLLPYVQRDREMPQESLDAYVNTYLKEEIRQEGVVRNEKPFIRFLNIVGQLNGQLVNGLNIAKDAAISRSTVDNYFSILEDTLLGHFLPSYRPQTKIREVSHPKFYWFDPGVARAAAGLLRDPLDGIQKRISLETILFHELRIYNQISYKKRNIAFYRTSSGSEIDFIIETRKRTFFSKPEVLGIEVKSAVKWNRKWEKPIRSLMESEQIIMKKAFGVYQGENIYTFDNITILPVYIFLEKLYKGEIF